MKNLLILFSIAFLFCGCTTIPTVESMTNLGLSSGYTASIVLNTQTKMTPDTRSAVVSIISEVEKYTPETNSTYTATWTPIAQTYITNLISNQKINQMVGDNVLMYFGYITHLLDAYIETKGIRQQTELSNAFIHGFCSSFLMNFKGANTLKTSSQHIDDFTYEILNKNIN